MSKLYTNKNKKKINLAKNVTIGTWKQKLRHIKTTLKLINVKKEMIELWNWIKTKKNYAVALNK